MDTKQTETIRRVLLIEDQSLAGEVTKIILSDLNCQVDIAINSKIALQKIQINFYDIILMDIGLPDLDGYETTQRIRLIPSINQRVPIIALTAHVDSNDRQRCIASGMNAILLKPLMKETALEILHAFIPKIEEIKIPIAANDETDWSKVPGKVIDLEMGSQFFNGNVELAKKMITTMITNIGSELEELDKAYKTKNWEVLNSIVHKLRGDVSYCGTPRLQEAFARLENHLKAGYRELAPLLYKQLLKEIETVKNKQSALTDDA